MDGYLRDDDLLGIRLIAVRGAGLRALTLLAIMGFDDIPLAKLISPALTTVAATTKTPRHPCVNSCCLSGLGTPKPS